MQFKSKFITQYSKFGNSILGIISDHKSELSIFRNRPAEDSEQPNNTDKVDVVFAFYRHPCFIGKITISIQKPNEHMGIYDMVH
jgi:hypothetical protein